ncbi:tRNA (guanine(9)-N(1))-methyltransferase [Thecaphora frezii]
MDLTPRVQSPSPALAPAASSPAKGSTGATASPCTAAASSSPSTTPHIKTSASPHPLSNRSQVHIDVSALPPGLSKSAAKKLAKRQYFEETKLDRRRAEKEKKKQKKRAFWEQQQQQQDDAADHEAGAMGGKRKRGDAKADTKPKKQPFGARLVVDVGFDDLMSEKEVASLGQQLMYLYSSNKGSHRPFKEVVLAGRGNVLGSAYLAPTATAIDGKDSDGPQPTQEEQQQPPQVDVEPPSIFESPLGHWMEQKMRGAWRSWKGITIHERGGLEGLIAHRPLCCSDKRASPHAPASPDAAPSPPLRLAKEDVVYLTADTDDTLACLEEGKTYIIGGIVDKNRYKSLCLNKATKLGIRCAKLPISEENLAEFERRLRLKGETSRPGSQDAQGHAKGSYQGRKVLTVNQVADILLGWNETEDWVEAIGRGIPRRRFEGGPSDAAEPDSAPSAAAAEVLSEAGA